MNKKKKNEDKPHNSESPQITFEEAVKRLLETPPKKKSELVKKKHISSDS